MTRLILRRLLLMVPTLLLVSLLIFMLSEILPGDVARTILGQYATPEQVQALNTEMGADKPIVERYAAWLGHFVTGNWGTSPITDLKVAPQVVDALGNSLLLAGLALVVIIPLSILLGVLAGLRKDSLLDRGITISTRSLTVIPEFVSESVEMVMPLSSRPSLRKPATTPRRMERGMMTTSANPASSSELPSASTTCGATFRSVIGDVPQLPVTKWLSQAAYRSTIGLSAPILVLSASTCSGVAYWPKMVRATSPGRISLSMKMSSDPRTTAATISTTRPSTRPATPGPPCPRSPRTACYRSSALY